VEEMPKKADDPRWKSLFEALDKGEAIGVISDAGCPGIADPGSLVVQYAHRQNKVVEPLVGPSSFTLALMAAGFNGQAFAFHGYLPIDKAERKKTILKLEAEAVQKKSTQMFMETPYRNQSLLQTIVNACKPDTQLCIAANLTSPDAFVRTQSIRDWKAAMPDIHKIPAVFLLLAH
jgi:16S rRNA (cytidine1402-2'-O)-methyltransferase